MSVQKATLGSSEETNAPFRPCPALPSFEDDHAAEQPNTLSYTCITELTFSALPPRGLKHWLEGRHVISECLVGHMRSRFGEGVGNGVQRMHCEGFDNGIEVQRLQAA